jgi:hypothetical protein
MLMDTLEFMVMKWQIDWQDKDVCNIKNQIDGKEYLILSVNYKLFIMIYF